MVRPLGNDGVNLLTVKGCHVLYIISRFKPAFYLKRTDAGVHHGLDVGAAVHVAKGEQVAVFHDSCPLLVSKVEG